MGKTEVKDIEKNEMSEKELTQEKRARRKKRRIRNQIMAYVTLVLVIAMIGSGGFMTWNYFGQAPVEKPKEEEPNSVMQSQVEDLINKEPEISKPEPTVEPEPEPTPQERLDEIVDAAIGMMPLEDRVAGLFIVTPEAITGVGTAVKAGEGTKTPLEANPVGGLIYFEKNIRIGGGAHRRHSTFTHQEHRGSCGTDLRKA